MANSINILKPSVCFEVQKIIGISTDDGSYKTYQVQWAPSWISGLHLAGCEDLIQQFEREQTEDHVKIEEDDADPSQDICGLANNDIVDVNHSHNVCGLADRKNNDRVVVQDDNLHDSEPTQQTRKNIQDNTDTNTNSIFSQRHIHRNGNINLKASSLNSIIENITQSNNEQYVGRRTVHPDFQALKTNLCKVNNRSAQPNMEDDNTKQEASGVSSEQVEDMVIVKEASDCGHTESSQLKAVSYFSDDNRNLTMRNISFGKIPIKVTSKMKRDVNMNADFLTEGDESSMSCKNKHGKISLEIRNKARSTVCCNICNKVFSSDLALKKHSKLHKGIHQCATCCKTFTLKSNLEKHELVHSVDKDVSCSFCKEIFSDMDKLLVHIQVHKTVKQNPLECPYCPKIFFSKMNVRVHTRVHTGECPFECNVCQRRFNVKQNLQRHLRTHAKEGL